MLSNNTHVYCVNCKHLKMEYPYPQYTDIPKEPVCKNDENNQCYMGIPWDSEPFYRRPLYSEIKNKGKKYE